MKCGTTFITNRLSRHPDIYMPPIRELRFWENHFLGQPLPKQPQYALNALDRIRKQLDEDAPIDAPLERLTYWHRYAGTSSASLDGYRALFAPGEGYRAAGEISPSYVEMSGDSLKRLAATLPEARILVTMRAPYKRLVSHYNHVTRLRPHEVADDATTIAWLDNPRVVAQVEYGTLLENAFAAFGRDRVKALFFETMVDKPKVFFREICDFLDVPFNGAVVPPKRDKQGSAKREMSDRVETAFRDRVAHVPEAVHRLVGKVPAAWERSA